MPSDNDVYGASRDDMSAMLHSLRTSEKAFGSPRNPVAIWRCIHCKTPAGGIAGRTGLQMNSAECDLYDCSSTGLLSDSTTDVTIYNPVSNAIAELTHIVAAKNTAGLWVAIVEDCP